MGDKNMKKLMTVLASIATTAFVASSAYADLTGDMGFEDFTAGDDLNTAQDDAGLVDGQSGFAKTWVDVSATIEAGAAVISNYNSDAYSNANYTAGVGNNYLKLDTGTNEVSRYVQAGGTALDIGDGLYIDTLVQFTACDADSAPTPGSEDKICIWLQNNENDETACPLMITAGYVNNKKGTDIIATNYTTSATFSSGTWHRLQVKILSAIDSDDLGVLGAGFVVLVDGEAVTSTESPFSSAYTGTLNARAAAYNVEGAYAIFPSLLKLSAEGSGTITSLSFKGSGSVDNISFSNTTDIDPIVIAAEYEPVQAATEYTYTGEEIVGVSAPDGAYGWEFSGESNIGTAVGPYETIAALAAGYAWSDGATTNRVYNWSIVESGSSSSVEPGASVEVASEEAAAAVTMAVPSAVTKAGVDSATYTALFTKTVTATGTGTYTVSYELSETTTNEVQTAVNEANTATLTGVLAAEVGAESDIAVTTKPGLYYAIVTSTSLPVDEPATSDWAMATTTETAISVTKPEGTAAFFKVYCTAVVPTAE